MFESPTLLLGVWVGCHLHHAHYQQTKSAPTSHGFHLEMLWFSQENHKASVSTEPSGFVLFKWLAIHLKFWTVTVTSPTLNFAPVLDMKHLCCERMSALLSMSEDFAKKIPLFRHDTCRSNYCQVVTYPQYLSTQHKQIAFQDGQISILQICNSNSIDKIRSVTGRKVHGLL